jgi:outer membrane murein-binding lipoprotein Lpp
VISFRYHLVSLVAVFLALALGIVVGTTALNGPITTDLRKQVNSLKTDRSTLAAQVKTLQGRVGDAEQFAQTYGAQLVANALTDQDVLVVAMPGAGVSVEDAIIRDITQAGGKISGRLALTNDYIDPRRGSDITALATGALHPIGWSAPVTSDAGQLGGSLLAYVLLGSPQATDLNQVLGGFAGLHMVSVSGTPRPSKTVVVVGTGALPNGDYGAQTELAFVNALQTLGGHVLVAGDAASATHSGIVASVRGANGPKATVSTVDNADTAMGQVTSVLAIADIAKSVVGHYGTGSGADALFPTPSTK